MSMIPLAEIKEVKPARFAECPLGRNAGELSPGKSLEECDKPLGVVCENLKNCPIENGYWDGERGNSTWYPDRDFIPGKVNPEGKTSGEILDKYGIDGISYKDGEPDFSCISKETVEIEGFSDIRPQNFDKADMALANQRGCSPEEVKAWREENRYTWHECRDMRTMQKVPSEVHSNITHSGGVSEFKKGAED